MAPLANSVIWDIGACLLDRWVLGPGSVFPSPAGAAYMVGPSNYLAQIWQLAGSERPLTGFVAASGA